LQSERSIADRINGGDSSCAKPRKGLKPDENSCNDGIRDDVRRLARTRHAGIQQRLSRIPGVSLGMESR
jgi:hypothetical protein